MNNFWIIDGHCDSLGDYAAGKRTLNEKSGNGHWDLPSAFAANIKLQFLAAYIESEYKPYTAHWRGLELTEAALRFIDENKERVYLIQTKDDLKNLRDSDKIGLLLNIEGGEILGESIFMVDLLYRLGVRSIGLTWNERNAIGEGVGDPLSKAGLSRFGREVIKKMNKLGMIVDVSHLNEPGFWDVVALSERPVIASHSCAQALCSHPRNLSDAQLRALAQNNGLVGINFCQDFLNAAGQADIEDVVRHICHIAEVAGVDTVGFGSDFDGIPTTPKGLENAAKYPDLIERLLHTGFSSADVQKICHGNFVRVLADVLK